MRVPFRLALSVVAKEGPSSTFLYFIDITPSDCQRFNFLDAAG
jgi:hypothetical protein